MGSRAVRVFEKIPQSPNDIKRAIATFSANARAFNLTKEEALAKYKDKWIAIYNGQVQAVADDLESLAREVAEKSIPASQTLFRHISSKDKVFIL